MKTIAALGLIVSLLAGIMWLACSTMALISFGGFSGHDIFFVATFFGCFTIFGFLISMFAYFRDCFKDLEKRISELDRREE